MSARGTVDLHEIARPEILDMVVLMRTPRANPGVNRVISTWRWRLSLPLRRPRDCRGPTCQTMTISRCHEANPSASISGASRPTWNSDRTVSRLPTANGRPYDRSTLYVMTGHKMGDCALRATARQPREPVEPQRATELRSGGSFHRFQGPVGGGHPVRFSSPY